MTLIDCLGIIGTKILQLPVFGDMFVDVFDYKITSLEPTENITYAHQLPSKRIHLPLLDGDAIQAFSHTDPERNEHILEALEEQQDKEDLEDVLEDEPIN